MFPKKLLWAAAASVVLTGCIDDKYDLSNIDTTSEFKVNDLTLPINLAPVVLSDIIKVEEGDQLKDTTINGKTFYAVVQKGKFNSDGIDIDKFEAEPDPMYDKTATFRPRGGEAQSKRRADTGIDIYYLIEPVTEDLEYEASGIDGSIKALTAINFQPLSLKLEISTTSLPAGVESQLENLVLYIPTGLTIDHISAGGETYPVTVYDPSDGSLDLATVKLNDNKATIQIVATAIDLKGYDHPYNYDEEMGEGTFALISQFNIQDSQLALSGSIDQLASINEINYNVHYELEPLYATSIMGSIAYDLSGTGLDIDPIDLENLPDFLDDPETDLALSNPQIYLQLMNPIGKYGLSYQSSLDIIAERSNQHTSFESPLVKVPGHEGTFNYVLAPNTGSSSLNVPKEYEANLEALVYPNLGSILSGEGLPKQLLIDIIDPMIPEQPTKAPFELDQSIEGMEGNYLFLAPLSLKEGSKIVKTVDGWWSEDLNDLNIDYLTISADAINGLSTGVILTLYAIDRDGNKISSEGSVVLEESSASQPIDITIEGIDGKPFNGLDGIQLYVIAGENEGQPLAPDQTITLNELKAKVTGNYTRKL